MFKFKPLFQDQDDQDSENQAKQKTETKNHGLYPWFFITAIKRTSAYRFLESLEDKGLIEWIISDRGRRVKTDSSDNLILFLNIKKAQIDELEKALPKFISQFNLSKPSEKFETQIRYYKGEQGIE